MAEGKEEEKEKKEIRKQGLVKAYDPELEYATDLEKATAVALLFFIVLFLTVRHMEIKAYKPKTEKVMVAENINLQAQIEEPPPPKAKPQVPKQIAEATTPQEAASAASADTVSIGPTTFNEAQLPPPPVNDTVYSFALVQQKPKLIKRVLPEYPELARKAGLEGKVIVEYIVGKDGHVREAHVIKSDNEIFNQSALNAVKQYVFKPAMQNDRPVSVRVIQPIVFTLER